MRIRSAPFRGMAQFCAATTADKNRAITRARAAIPFGVQNLEEEVAVSRAVYAHPPGQEMAQWKWPDC